ncbi:hypothetical protein REPUB_Repub18cG0086500 [Reevesia pubescens]
MEDIEILLEVPGEHNLALTRFMVIGNVISNHTLNCKRVKNIFRGIWSKEMAGCI